MIPKLLPVRSGQSCAKFPDKIIARFFSIDGTMPHQPRQPVTGIIPRLHDMEDDDEDDHSKNQFDGYKELREGRENGAKWVKPLEEILSMPPSLAGSGSPSRSRPKMAGPPMPS